MMNNKKGFTLVESIMAITLMLIVLAFVAPTLSAATKIFYRLQQDQYAQSILDTVMTELRGEANEVNNYIKIYATSELSEEASASSGTTLEYINNEGYVVLFSTQGCEKTTLYIGSQANATVDPVESGQLLKRYYFRNDSDGTYQYQNDDELIARAVSTVYGSGFYMGNYLKVTYSLPDTIQPEDKTNQIIATVELYKDQECSDLLTSESEILEFRNEVTVSNQTTIKDLTQS